MQLVKLCIMPSTFHYLFNILKSFYRYEGGEILHMCVHTMSATNVARHCGVERNNPIATKSMMKKICGCPKDVLSVT